MPSWKCHFHNFTQQ